MKHTAPLITLLAVWIVSLPLTTLVALCRFVYASFVHPQVAWNMAIAYDQFLNATANGDPDETISSRAGKARDEGKAWGCILCKWFLDRIEKDHCSKAKGI